MMENEVSHEKAALNLIVISIANQLNFMIDSLENKKKILSKFLEVAAFDGWNEDALLKAMSELKIDEKFLSLIFENGCIDLCEFYIHEKNEEAGEAFNFKHLSETKIRNKIRFALYERFEVEKNNKIALQRLVNFYLNPKNFASVKTGPKPLFQAIKDCYKISDFIWYLIGDKSTDFNFYTKRLTLSKIILRALFVFLKDESENFSKTKNFIDLQIEKVMKFEKRKSQIKNYSSKVFHHLSDCLFDEKGELKSPKNIIKNLPFIRLF